MTQINFNQSIIKLLKNGQYKMPLKPKIKSLLNNCSLHRAKQLEHENEDYLRQKILLDISTKLREADKAVKLTATEMICLFEEETFYYISESEQMYIWTYFNRK